MRPYLAVIYDSFVEATSSKVLWVLLVAWTLILAGIAPFSLIQDRSYEFSSSEVLVREAMIEKLEGAARGKGTKAQQAVVAAMKEESRDYLAREKKNEGRRFSSGRIADLLNEAVQAEELYSQEAWPNADKRSEMKDLLAKSPSALPKIDREHLHRRLIEIAFQGSLKPVNESRVWVGYASIKIGDPLPFSESQSRMFIESFVLQAIMKLGLGVVAMFIAIIVTSTMIPDMFQPGSLHLLLSKPVSRSLLFLSKFAGGCIFVAINIAYLLTGLYLIAGIRLNIWNEGVLLCIPVLVFVFMIFYSVSALAGLIWKNAIVSVVVTGVFWLLCFVLGVAQGIMKPIVEVMPQQIELLPIGDQLFGVRQEGGLSMWDTKSNTWQVAFDSARGGNLKVLGPYWFADKGELYYGRAFQSPFGMETDNIRMSVASLPELAQTKLEGESKDKKSDLWSDKRTDAAPNLPVRTRRVLTFRNTLLVLTDLGIFQFDRDRQNSKQEAKGAIADLVNSAFSRILPGKASAFQQITPESWQPQAPMDFAISPDEKTIAVYHQGSLEILRPNDEGKWLVEKSAKIFEKRDQLALVAIHNDRWVLAGKDQIPLRGTIDDPNDKKEWTGIEKLVPRRLLPSPDQNTFVLLDGSGHVTIFDAHGEKVIKPELEGQGKASAIAFDSENRLVVAHQTNYVDRWDLKKNSSQSVARPTMRIVDQVFYYVVNPIYWVNPKPSAVDETIQYCLKPEESVGFALDTSGLANARTKIDPWQPLWSNSIFIGVMLALGCLYLHRQDL